MESIIPIDWKALYKVSRWRYSCDRRAWNCDLHSLPYRLSWVTMMTNCTMVHTVVQCTEWCVHCSWNPWKTQNWVNDQHVSARFTMHTRELELLQTISSLYLYSRLSVKDLRSVANLPFQLNWKSSCRPNWWSDNCELAMRNIKLNELIKQALFPIPNTEQEAQLLLW